jgi:hypothetical protein
VLKEPQQSDDLNSLWLYELSVDDLLELYGVMVSMRFKKSKEVKQLPREWGAVDASSAPIIIGGWG